MEMKMFILSQENQSRCLFLTELKIVLCHSFLQNKCLDVLFNSQIYCELLGLRKGREEFLRNLGYCLFYSPFVEV